MVNPIVYTLKTSCSNVLDSSLRLIKVDRLELVVFQPGRDFGNYQRRVQGRFTYGDADYWLRVTDPVYERRYLGALSKSTFAPTTSVCHTRGRPLTLVSREGAALNSRPATGISYDLANYFQWSIS